MRFPLCILAFGFALAPAQEAWFKVPPPVFYEFDPSSTYPVFLQADQDGRMVYRGRADYYHTELYEWRDGAYRILEHPEPEGFARNPFYGPDGALWITISHSFGSGANTWAIYRRKQGSWMTFDSSNTCIPGNVPAMVGVDAQGNAIIDSRPRGGNTSGSRGPMIK